MSLLDEPNLTLKVGLGHEPGWRNLRKFGMNPAVTSSSSQEMWPIGTAKVLPTAAGALAVASDSAEDDENEATPPGTGAFSIRVEGLDANYEEISEDIALTGTTPAASTASFLRVNRAYCTTVGSNGVNVGNITISIGGNAQAYIEANEGQTHQTHYTVPAGHTWVVTGYFMQVGRMAGAVDLHILGQIRLYDETSNDNYQSWRTISDIYLWNGADWMNDGTATPIPAKSDVRQVIDTDATTQASAVISGYLIKNDRFDV
jgi:hypothetical protein